MTDSLKIMRLRAGKIQWEMARELNISEVMLSKIENGRRLVSDELAEKIAVLLDQPIEAVRNAARMKAKPQVIDKKIGNIETKIKNLVLELEKLKKMKEK